MNTITRILFIGDSITDCGRDINNQWSLGNGYVKIFNDKLTVEFPHLDFQVINKGLNGNTLGHLLSRWGDDVYENHPDVIFILIGINDAIRLMDKSTSYHLEPDKFATIFKKIIIDTKNILPETKVILIEPFYLTKGANPEGSYRNEMKTLVNEYIEAVKNISMIFDLEVVELNNAFNKVMKYKTSSVLSDDKIHPNGTGHLLIAEEIFKIFSSKVMAGGNYTDETNPSKMKGELNV